MNYGHRNLVPGCIGDQSLLPIHNKNLIFGVASEGRPRLHQDLVDTIAIQVANCVDQVVEGCLVCLVHNRTASR